MQTLNNYSICRIAKIDTQAITWQMECLFHQATDRQQDDTKLCETTISLYNKLEVQWRIGKFYSISGLCWPKILYPKLGNFLSSKLSCLFQLISRSLSTL